MSEDGHLPGPCPACWGPRSLRAWVHRGLVQRPSAAGPTDSPSLPFSEAPLCPAWTPAPYRFTQHWLVVTFSESGFAL